jgi:flagellar hook-length control protein FliK
LAAPVAATVAPPASASVSSVPVQANPALPFAAQVSQPILTLTTAVGDHTLTINVAPDNLGPVTVRAHVTADGMQVQLFAPNDAGRDALRAILPDLRRDLAGSGLSSSLDLSSQNQPNDLTGGSPQDSRPARLMRGDGVHHASSEPVPERRQYGVSYRSTSTIDVMA